jgi:hydrogenase maturation protease
MSERVVVAGIGNVFLGDDGFGVEVVRCLQERGTLDGLDGVDVVDVGVRGLHLAFDLLNGCDLLVLVDAAPIGEEPGTLAVLEAELGAGAGTALAPIPIPAADAHGMTPDAVVQLVQALGGRLARVVVVACQPLTVDECLGLSLPVAGAIDPAARVVGDIVREHRRARANLRFATTAPQRE